MAETKTRSQASIQPRIDIAWATSIMDKALGPICCALQTCQIGTQQLLAQNDVPPHVRAVLEIMQKSLTEAAPYYNPQEMQP